MVETLDTLAASAALIGVCGGVLGGVALAAGEAVTHSTTIDVYAAEALRDVSNVLPGFHSNLTDCEIRWTFYNPPQPQAEYCSPHHARTVGSQTLRLAVSQGQDGKLSLRPFSMAGHQKP